MISAGKLNAEGSFHYLDYKKVGENYKLFLVTLSVVQELDYVDLAVLHYVSQTRTDTLNAEIMSEASPTIKICDVWDQRYPFKENDV